MPGTDPTVPADWFARGDLDLQTTEILLGHGGPLEMAAFHLQQTIEKYLKGFLIHQGWRLRRIHHLDVLIQEAIARDPDFAPFLSPCQTINEYYMETRYPMGVYTPFSHADIANDLNTTRALITLIRSKVTP